MARPSTGGWIDTSPTSWLARVFAQLDVRTVIGIARSPGWWRRRRAPRRPRSAPHPVRGQGRRHQKRPSTKARWRSWCRRSSGSTRLAPADTCSRPRTRHHPRLAGGGGVPLGATRDRAAGPSSRSRQGVGGARRCKARRGAERSAVPSQAKWATRSGVSSGIVQAPGGSLTSHYPVCTAQSRLDQFFAEPSRIFVLSSVVIDLDGVGMRVLSTPSTLAAWVREGQLFHLVIVREDYPHPVRLRRDDRRDVLESRSASTGSDQTRPCHARRPPPGAIRSPPLRRRPALTRSRRRAKVARGSVLELAGKLVPPGTDGAPVRGGWPTPGEPRSSPRCRPRLVRRPPPPPSTIRRLAPGITGTRSRRSSAPRRCGGSWKTVPATESGWRAWLDVDRRGRRAGDRGGAAAQASTSSSARSGSASSSLVLEARAAAGARRTTCCCPGRPGWARPPWR